MQIKSKLLPGVYTDSMSLMALSTKVNQLPGVEKAMIGMGTDMNKQVINDVGLMTPELEAATPADMWDDTNGLYNQSDVGDWVPQTQRYARAHGLRYYPPSSWIPRAFADLVKPGAFERTDYFSSGHSER